MHFVFHTLGLSDSGGSRVIVNLSNYLSEANHNVSIIIDNNRVAFPLNDKVRVFHLKDFSIKEVTPKVTGDTSTFQRHLQKKSDKKKTRKRKKLREKSKLIHSLYLWKKYLLKLLTFPSRKYVMNKFLRGNPADLIASHNMYYFLEHYFFYPKRKFAVVIHNSPENVFNQRGVQSLLPLNWYFKNTRCFPVSSAALNELRSIIPSISTESKAIYNPFDFNEIRERAEETIDGTALPERYIISVASFDHRKRIERTIFALSEMEDEKLELVLLGVGKEEEKLRKLVQQLDLQERVHFLGFITNPMPFIKQAQALVLSSDSEGLPTVLIESLICGTKVVSTNCKTGPSEILTGDLKQFLIDIEGRTEEAIIADLAKAIDKAVSDELLIEDDELFRFSKEAVVKEYISIAANGS